MFNLYNSAILRRLASSLKFENRKERAWVCLPLAIVCILCHSYILLQGGLESSTDKAPELTSYYEQSLTPESIVLPGTILLSKSLLVTPMDTGMRTDHLHATIVASPSLQRKIVPTPV